METKNKKPKVWIVAVRAPSGYMTIQKFETEEQANKFVAYMKLLGCRTLMGVGT